MQKYLFPVFTAVFLLLFFLGIPELSKRTLLRGSNKKISRTDLLLMAALTLFSGISEFTFLGNTSSVESFVNMNGKSAVISCPDSTCPEEIVLFTGVGYGIYSFSFSEDGTEYGNEISLKQDSGDVLRWKKTEFELPEQVHFIRITASGDAWLGEICAIGNDSQQIPLQSSIPELTDEQERFCPEYDFRNSSYFDEIYHARTAWEHLNNVYPYEISHPPLGKLIISLGIALFGMTPFGWRFSGTLFGVLMTPIMYVFLKKLFGSTRSAAAGTLVFASDFMHLVQTRIATIDTYSVFFILLMYLFMYIYISEDKLWALACCGISFGLGAASKWTSIYAGAGLAVIWLVYRLIKRKEGFCGFLKNALFCTVFFILIPCCIYYLSYFPYGRAQNVKNIFSRDYLKIVLDNQVYMFNYHSGLVATHPYSSYWYQWVLNIRPILYYLQYFDNGTRSSFGAFLNPMLCWGGLLSLFIVLYRSTFYIDREASFITVGYFFQLVPWIFITRLTFEYHYFPCTIFLTAAVTYVFSIMEKSGKHAKLYIWGFSLFSVVLFFVFYPVLTGLPVSSSTWLFRWLPTWPF